jgi:hypothetical protein
MASMEGGRLGSHLLPTNMVLRFAMGFGRADQETRIAVDE